MLHVDFLFSGTFWMIILSAFRVFAFDTSTAFGLFAYKALVFVAFFVDIFNPSHINDAIFFFKVALRHPDRADIMHPNIMTAGLI